MDFQAIIQAQLDLAQAQSQYNTFASAVSGKPINIPINLQNAGQSGQAFGVTFTNAFNNSFSKGIKVGSNNQVAFNNIVKNYQRSLSGISSAFNTTKIDTFDKQITAWAKSNSKAIDSVMSDGVKTYGQAMSEYHNELSALQADIANNGGNITSAHIKWFADIRDGFRNLQADAKSTGNVGKTFGEQFASAFGSLTKFATSYIGIRQVFNTMREGISTVVALDDALVDLQKTTTATPKQLTSFYKEANDVAKEYGTTTEQVISQAASWSRLGYNINDSKTMAKLSSQFAAISPGMSVDQATSGLVSTMKANLCLVV